MVVSSIICLVLLGLLALFCGYLFLKTHNTSKRIVQLTEFMHGDVFSDRFHHVLSNYFLDNNNVKALMDPITPIVSDIVSQQIKQTYLSNGNNNNNNSRQGPDTDQHLRTLHSGINLLI